MDTERPSPRYSGIDVWEPADVLDAMIEGQFAAVAAVRAARFPEPIPCSARGTGLAAHLVTSQGCHVR